MKNLCVVLVTALMCISCKKAIQQEELNLITQEITSGQWKVSSYTIGSNDSTVLFSGYTFKFNTDNTVNANFNGSLKQTGNWSGNINNQTVTSFFSNPTHPLDLLNGTWQVISSSDTSVEAQENVSGETRKLRLDKI